MTTLVLEFKRTKNVDKTKYCTFYLTSNAETITNNSDIGDGFKSIYSTILSSVQKSLKKGLGWIIDLAPDHNINISKYKYIAVSKLYQFT